ETQEKFYLIAAAKSDDGRVIGPLATTCVPAEKRRIVSSAIEKEYRRIVRANFKNDISMIGVHGIGGTSLDLGSSAVSIAREAGASEMLIRQPFPVQALSIRMLCNDSAIALTTEQREMLDKVVAERGERRFSPKLVPFRSVGICNGVRSYKSMAVLSDNGAYSDFLLAADIAVAIEKRLPYINRVLCRVDSDSKAMTYHGSPMHISKDTLDVVRIADGIVTEEFSRTSAVQFFAVLLPFVSDIEKSYSVAIRAVATKDFKTASALIPDVDFDAEILHRTAKRIKEKLSSVDMVLYDITGKPPAAIEFE
ncbi:MAG: hypothetical protein IJN48_03485, partial [Clostridia bacterium]|nr:hypothetical protein [Clostridia bacterium]